MAQDFQDLTGQVIRRVINLVHDVEQNLVGLVRISGERLSTGAKEEAEEHEGCRARRAGDIRFQ
jgi:chemotaxis protein CheZ